MKRHLRSIPNCGNGVRAKAKTAEETLRALQQQEWQEYHQIRSTLRIRQPDRSAAQRLTDCIVPQFSKLGFEDHFTHTLLCLASEAWRLLKATPQNIVELHPNMNRDLDEVRSGLLIQADKKMASEASPTYLTPQDTYEIVQQTMDPANLHQILDEVTTPWIILPRAYNALRAEQAYYLPAYLEMIEKETNEEALHIFTRIAIEFLASYAIRFADAAHPKNQVARLVTAGYRAMYWKQLEIPPRGFEDVRLFEHYLSWLKYSDIRSIAPDLDMKRIIRSMEVHKARIFPFRSERCREDPECRDNNRFLVALRHGCLGIASTLRCFAGKPSGGGPTFDKGMVWGALLFDLKSLFHLFASRYGSESRRTQYYIREFIYQLENAYSLTLHNDGSGAESAASLIFLRTRISAMIDQLKHKLATVPDPPK